MKHMSFMNVCLMVIRDEEDRRRCGLIRKDIAKQGAMSSGFVIPVSVVDAHQLSAVIRNRIENVLIIDSRSFIEHNACHISSAVNVCCSKIVKRRLQQDKLSVKELLTHTCHCDVDEKMDVVVYDQSSKDADSLPVDSFIAILVKKLQLAFRSVNLLTGGFEEFQKFYPDLCQDKTRKCPSLTSLSQPCLPIANQGPTRILPFLYLGSQFDALNKELLKDHNITYELNVSTTCPQPEFVQEGHFMRIPVNDTYSEKLLPYFPEAFNFLDKVREGSGCVLVHCLAGISRSPTVAIAYVMRYLHLTSDDGYRYVKSKRPSISPNFNFLGQLLEYEKQLKKENILDAKPEVTSAPPLCSKKRLCRTDMRTSKLSLDIDPQKNENPNIFLQPRSGDQSPTTALAKLSFDVKQTTTNSEEGRQTICPDFRQYRSKSCYGDFLRDREDNAIERKSTSIATTSKVLSPVKEIKCDALISEISTGDGKIAVKSEGLLRQRVRLLHHDSEEKQYNSFSQICIDKHGMCSAEVEQKFSLQTLTHHPSTANAKFPDLLKKSELKKLKDRSSPSKLVDFQNYRISLEENNYLGTNKPYLSECGNKRVCHVSLDRSKDLTPRKEKSDSHFVFREHTAPQYKISSSLHPFSFNAASYRRSDSAGTSGFGSESSDYADHCSEATKNSENFRLDIDVAELEDDVIARSQALRSKNSVDQSASDRTFFPLTFPDVTVREWTSNLGSPLSPSESHLLEDLETGKASKTEPSSPSGSSYPSEDPDIFHDSGIPLSPSWVCPRKRVANFDTAYPTVASGSATRDKRKYEPFIETISFNEMKDKGLWFLKSDLHLSEKKETFTSFDAYQFPTSDDKIGLYRVQSCPGILYHVSSLCSPDDQSKGFCTQKKVFEKGSHMKSIFTDAPQKELICHESCPDVLHLDEHRHRDFRKNVRMIQVS